MIFFFKVSTINVCPLVLVFSLFQNIEFYSWLWVYCYCISLCKYLYFLYLKHLKTNVACILVIFMTIDAVFNAMSVYLSPAPAWCNYYNRVYSYAIIKGNCKGIFIQMKTAYPLAIILLLIAIINSCYHFHIEI